MDNKYFWFVYGSVTRSGEITYGEEVSKNSHPFLIIQDLKTRLNGSGWYDIFLMNFKEISEHEYYIFPKDE